MFNEKVFLTILKPKLSQILFLNLKFDLNSAFNLGRLNYSIRTLTPIIPVSEIGISDLTAQEKSYRQKQVHCSTELHSLDLQDASGSEVVIFFFTL